MLGIILWWPARWTGWPLWRFGRNVLRPRWGLVTLIVACHKFGSGFIYARLNLYMGMDGQKNKAMRIDWDGGILLCAADTVASDYARPAIGARSGLTPVRLCPCRANKTKSCKSVACRIFDCTLAERTRFELVVGILLRQFSKLVVSATHPPLQWSFFAFALQRYVFLLTAQNFFTFFLMLIFIVALKMTVPIAHYAIQTICSSYF